MLRLICPLMSKGPEMIDCTTMCALYIDKHEEAQKGSCSLYNLTPKMSPQPAQGPGCGHMGKVSDFK